MEIPPPPHRSGGNNGRRGGASRFLPTRPDSTSCSSIRRRREFQGRRGAQTLDACLEVCLGFSSHALTARGVCLQVNVPCLVNIQNLAFAVGFAKTSNSELKTSSYTPKSQRTKKKEALYQNRGFEATFEILISKHFCRRLPPPTPYPPTQQREPSPRPKKKTLRRRNWTCCWELGRIQGVARVLLADTLKEKQLSEAVVYRWGRAWLWHMYINIMSSRTVISPRSMAPPPAAASRRSEPPLRN